MARRSSPVPRKPTERKRKLDVSNKPLPEPVQFLPAADGVPEPIRPLGQAGMKLWERIWTAGLVWISPDSDIELLQLLCESMDERQQLRIRVLTGGEDVPWRDRVGLRQLDKQIVDMMRELGFSPSERSRIGLAEVRTKQALVSLASSAKETWQ